MTDELFGLVFGSMIGLAICYTLSGFVVVITRDAQLSALVGILLISAFMAKWWYNINQIYMETGKWSYW